MADEDPTLFLKKKKKKKKVLTLEDDENPTPTANEPTEEKKTVAEEEEAPAKEQEEKQEKEQKAPVDDDDIAASLGELDLGKKKKKKKKKPFDPDGLLDDEPAATSSAPTEENPTNPEENPVLDFLGDDLALPTKKKKKKKDKPKAAAEDETVPAGDRPAWADSDRDYEYEELLQRVFDIMRQKNPEMIANSKKTFIMKPPQVLKVGSKKTAFVNFMDICKLLHRQPDHLLGYILAELGTSGSVDGNQSLVLKGRFTQKNVEIVLKGYIREYVTCKLCKSPNTILAKENRLFFLQCETCSSKRSVASIKSGFQAMIGRRSALRAKTST